MFCKTYRDFVESVIIPGVVHFIFEVSFQPSFEGSQTTSHQHKLSLNLCPPPDCAWTSHISGETCNLLRDVPTKDSLSFLTTEDIIARFLDGFHSLLHRASSPRLCLKQTRIVFCVPYSDHRTASTSSRTKNNGRCRDYLGGNALRSSIQHLSGFLLLVLEPHTLP